MGPGGSTSLGLDSQLEPVTPFKHRPSRHSFETTFFLFRILSPWNLSPVVCVHYLLPLIFFNRFMGMLTVVSFRVLVLDLFLLLLVSIPSASFAFFAVISSSSYIPPRLLLSLP
jgi:hypothetical protein